jgi:hypothetical protein
VTIRRPAGLTLLQREELIAEVDEGHVFTFPAI